MVVMVMYDFIYYVCVSMNLRRPLTHALGIAGMGCYPQLEEAGESFNLTRGGAGDWVLNPMAEKVGKVESG
jgi:hypothetical protein